MPETRRRGRKLAEQQRAPTPEEQWIEKHSDSLPANRWIAVRGQSAVAVAEDVDKLMDQLDADHVDPEEVTIIFNESLAL